MLNIAVQAGVLTETAVTRGTCNLFNLLSRNPSRKPNNTLCGDARKCVALHFQLLIAEYIFRGNIGRVRSIVFRLVHVTPIAINGRVPVNAPHMF